MKSAETKRAKLAERISSAVASDAPLRNLAGNLTQLARGSALNEADTLTVERVAITLERLPKNLDGLRVVHLSDFHHSPFTSLEHIRRAVETANDLKPDLFVLTGDFVSHEAEYIEPVAEVLGELKSEFGSFACLGNHDHWTNAEAVTNFLRRQNIRVLTNEGFRFAARGASFWLGGVDDYMVGRTDLRAALKGSFPDELKLLLAHNPKILNRAARASVDLIFSGHTHGGQVKLRAAEENTVPTRRKKFSSGLYRRAETQIYITRGIGTVVLPVRYGCPPEISLLELKCV